MNNKEQLPCICLSLFQKVTFQRHYEAKMLTKTNKCKYCRIPSFGETSLSIALNLIVEFQMNFSFVRIISTFCWLFFTFQYKNLFFSWIMHLKSSLKSSKYKIKRNLWWILYLNLCCQHNTQWQHLMWTVIRRWWFELQTVFTACTERTHPFSVSKKCIFYFLILFVNRINCKTNWERNGRWGWYSGVWKMGRKFGIPIEIFATEKNTEPVSVAFRNNIQTAVILFINSLIQTIPVEKNRIFASGQALAFNELMRRVKPMQEVKAVRDEVKVRKIERLNGKTTAVSVNNCVCSEPFFILNKKMCFRLNRLSPNKCIYIKQRRNWRNVCSN